MNNTTEREELIKRIEKFGKFKFRWGFLFGLIIGVSLTVITLRL